MAKTDAEVKEVVYAVIGSLIDAGWIMGQSERPEIQAMAAKFMEEAKVGEEWIDNILEGEG